jgi:Domain of unknown function (DUF4265)
MVEAHATRVPQTDGLVKIEFPLSEQDRQQGVDAENLWAVILTDGNLKIDNIPFYVYGVSYGDIVNAFVRGNCLVFRSVVRRGGHSTYRVLVADELGYESEPFVHLWRQIESLGCAREVAKRRWIAIDVPPSADADEVYKVLEYGEENGVWSFEEGHCGHAV